MANSRRHAFLEANAKANGTRQVGKEGKEHEAPVYTARVGVVLNLDENGKTKPLAALGKNKEGEPVVAPEVIFLQDKVTNKDTAIGATRCAFAVIDGNTRDSMYLKSDVDIAGKLAQENPGLLQKGELTNGGKTRAVIPLEVDVVEQRCNFGKGKDGNAVWYTGYRIDWSTAKAPAEKEVNFGAHRDMVEAGKVLDKAAREVTAEAEATTPEVVTAEAAKESESFDFGGM